VSFACCSRLYSACSQALAQAELQPKLPLQIELGTFVLRNSLKRTFSPEIKWLKQVSEYLLAQLSSKTVVILFPHFAWLRLYSDSQDISTSTN
jgi:hypothetical protein